MKKISLLLASLTALSFGAFAENQSVECTSDPSFAANTCQVCYTDTFDATETKDGWISTITSVQIPWKHNGGNLDEIIYSTEQKFPEIQTTLAFTTKPIKPEVLWVNDATLIWTPFSDHKEVFIKKGASVGLYTLAENASISVTGTKPDDSILFVTPLVVRDFDAKTNEDSDPKTRNICVKGTFTIKKNVEPTPLVTPAIDVPPKEEETVTTETALDNTTQTPEVVPSDTPPALNAAGPEPEQTATAEQTKTQAGPALWITLLLAFAFASGWNAWKKQKG